MRAICGVTNWPGEIRRFVDSHAETFDQTLPWWECFEKHVLPSGSSITAFAEVAADGQIVSMLPLQQARVRLMGSVTSAAFTAPTNYYTALFGPVRHPMASQSLRGFVREIIEHVGSRPVFDLSPVAEGADFLADFEGESRQAGWLTEIYPRFGNWIEPVGGRSFSEYLRDRPGQVRSTLQRKTKRFKTRDGTRLEVFTEAADLDAAVDKYEAIYRVSWKVDEPFRDFIREVARQFARRGWLRLGVLEVESVPAAAQIWFVYRGTASIFKLAYDPRFSDLSVGSLLTAHMFERALDFDGVQLVDYLCGDDAYKQDWMSIRRQRVGFRATRRASFPGGVEILRRAAKSALRRGRLRHSGR